MPIGEVEASELREQNHFRHLNRAIHKAIQAADEEVDAEGAWYTVELQLHVIKKSPGWVDGYKVVLTPTP
ncbi:MAG: hypothetical protein ACRDNP_14330 [Gaiellaceae bacterium]